MKRIALLVLPLCVSALCACGEPADPAQDYFSSLGDSLAAASSNSSFRAYSDSIRLNAGLSYVDEGKTKTGMLRLDPLCFDLRIDNLLDGSVKKTKLSLFGKNANRTKIVLDGDFAIGSLKSFEVTPRLYAEEETLYLDLTEAGTLRMMINTYFESYFSSPLPIKSKFVSELPEDFAYKASDFEKEPFVSKLGECYSLAKGAFGFAEKEGMKSVSFSSTDEAQLGLILEALRGKKEDEMVPAYDSIRDKFALTAFDFALSYNEIGPTGFDFKAGILFPEGAFEQFEQVGEWDVSGKINFAYGESAKAHIVEDPSSYSPVEVSLRLSA